MKIASFLDMHSSKRIIAVDINRYSENFKEVVVLDNKILGDIDINTTVKYISPNSVSFVDSTHKIKTFFLFAIEKEVLALNAFDLMLKSKFLIQLYNTTWYANEYYDGDEVLYLTRENDRADTSCGVYAYSNVLVSGNTLITYDTDNTVLVIELYTPVNIPLFNF